MKAAIEAIAQHSLSQRPDPVIRFRLLRDVLQLPAADAELLQVKAHLKDSWLSDVSLRPVIISE